MKSKLFKAVFGIGLFALALNVNANTINSVTEGSNTTNATVTVGEVEAPVYEVEVSWDDLTFDWTYNSETNKFGWTPSKVCVPVDTSDFDIYEEFYTDSTCSTEVTEYIGGTDYYRLESRKSASISIQDYSENGQIVPSIKWNSSSKYEDVVGNFKYYGETCAVIESEETFEHLKDRNLYTDSTCSTKVSTTPIFEAGKYYVLTEREGLNLTSEELPDAARTGGAGDCFGGDEGMFCSSDDWAGIYKLSFNLEGGTTNPTSGDEIGTITVSIRAK